MTPGSQPGEQVTLRKEGADEPKARTYEVVWKKEVVDEPNASSDGDEEGVRSYQELGRGDGKGETDASIPGGDHRANSGKNGRSSLILATVLMENVDFGELQNFQY